MSVIMITAQGDHDLREVYDRILDGEIDALCEVDKVDRVSNGSPLFAAGRGRIPEVRITLKRVYTDEEISTLVAELRKKFGADAHINVQR